MDAAEDGDTWGGVEDHQEQPIPTNAAMRIEVALLNILKDIGAPLGSFKRIMAWAANARAAGYPFIPDRQDYQPQVKYLEQLLKLSDLRPMKSLVVLEGHQQPALTVSFDFKAHLMSLLNDPTLNATENLVVNQDHPFLPYDPPDKRLGEILTGSWYRHAVTSMW